MSAGVLLVALSLFVFSVGEICKIKMQKDPELDSQGNVVKKDGGGIFGFIENFTPLGWGVGASFIAEAKDGALKSTVSFVTWRTAVICNSFPLREGN